MAERTAQLSQELTERQRAERELEVRNEELEQTNRELDDFAYIASHDLKEPLRGIHNYSSFLIEDYADGSTRTVAEARDAEPPEPAHGDADRLAAALLPARADRPGARRVDLNEVVDDVVDRLGISLREQHVEVRIPRRLPVVRSDRVRLGEVFANLIINAIKYNDKPQRWIEIGVAESRRSAVTGRTRRRSTCATTASAFPERHLDAVFRIFKRLHGRDQFGGGTGAGLTIVRKIVERHHGRVWIESSPGEGTTVFFTLQKETE